MSKEQTGIGENPAERAIAFLTHFSKASDSILLHNVGDVISDVYKVRRDDTAGLMKVVSEVWRIPDQLRSEITQVPNLDTAAYEKVIDDLEKVLSLVALDRQLNIIANKASNELLTMLGMVGALLKKDISRSTLSDQQRQAIVEQLTGALEEIRSAELDPEFAAFAVERVQAIITAIQLYDVLGASAVMERVEQMLGGLITRAPSISNSTVKKSVAKTMLTVAQGILLAMSITNGAFDLEHKIVGLIDAPSQHAPSATSGKEGSAKAK